MHRVTSLEIARLALAVELSLQTAWELFLRSQEGHLPQAQEEGVEVASYATSAAVSITLPGIVKQAA